MAPNKTLYIREADADIWERAEKVASTRGTSVSQFATEALRAALPPMLDEDDPTMQEIRVLVGNEERHVEKAFVGRWLVEYGEDSRTGEDGYLASACYGVALTKRGSIAVFASPSFDEPGALDVYDSLDDAENAGEPADILVDAAAAMGMTRTVWLDI